MLHRSTLRRSTLFGLLLPGVLLAVPLALSQQVLVPLKGQAPAAVGADGKPLPAPPQVFDEQHLKDRPYSGALPAPAYPSTDRVQRSFTVAYIYDYAFSSYTPAVDLPIVSPAQAKRDTPEAAAVAFYSAQRSGDWDAFLQCWTEEDGKRIQEALKTQKLDSATIVAKWKQYYGRNSVQLVDRIETMNYVILDARIAGPKPLQLPVVFKLVKGAWLATNDLGESGSPMLAVFQPSLAGIIQHVQPQPLSQLSGLRKHEAEAEQDFLKSHALRNEVDHTGQ